MLLNNSIKFIFLYFNLLNVYALTYKLTRNNVYYNKLKATFFQIGITLKMFIFVESQILNQVTNK